MKTGSDGSWRRRAVPMAAILGVIGAAVAHVMDLREGAADALGVDLGPTEALLLGAIAGGLAGLVLARLGPSRRPSEEPRDLGGGGPQ